MGITTTPQYPVVGQEITLTPTATRGSVFVWELLATPSGSILDPGFLSAFGLAGIEVAKTFMERRSLQSGIDNSALSNPQKFTADVAGDYNFRLYEFTEFSAAPAHDLDPTGTSRLEIVQQQDLTVSVGQKLSLPIRTILNRNVTITLGVIGTTIRTAAVSPFDSEDELTRIALLQSTVQTSLAALINVTVPNILLPPQTSIDELAIEYNDHRIVTAPAVHGFADTTNAVLSERSDSQTSAIDQINRLRAALFGHLVGASAAASAWHAVDDLKNLPVVLSAQDLGGATVLLCELRWRVYNRHRQQTASPASHGTSDTVNVLTAIKPLEQLIVDVIDALVAADPTAPIRESEGVQDLRHLHGFV